MYNKRACSIKGETNIGQQLMCDQHADFAQTLACVTSVARGLSREITCPRGDKKDSTVPERPLAVIPRRSGS